MGYWRRDYFWPAVLVVLGLYFLLNNLGLLEWLKPEIVWPIVLIALVGRVRLPGGVPGAFAAVLAGALVFWLRAATEPLSRN